jgi:ABC-type polysaccharide/polyol phosphate transport system ATPase subunit
VLVTLSAMASPVIDDGLPAVVARDVSKTFRLPQERVHTLKERALHPRRRVRYETFQALDQISFAVERGEFFGIAGRNGSGKSTLLKCIAGIYGCSGDIWCRGRLSTFIELGVGFNLDLAAQDNVVMNGIMMGLSPRDARNRVHSVIEFAELEEFKELKLKNYSSGMLVRLAFSVAIQVDADILLIDEVLAVGDASFQQKCFDAFATLRKQGKTIVFVTHDMGALQRFCHRALLLERGSPVYLGDTQEVADRYLEINFRREGGTGHSVDGGSFQGDAKVLDVWVENDRGERLTAAPQGQQVTLQVLIAYAVDVEDGHAGVFLHNDEQKTVLVLSTILEPEGTRFRAGDRAQYSYTFQNVLAPGRYSPVVNLADCGVPLDTVDQYESSFSFVVTGSRALGGVVDLPVEVNVNQANAVTFRDTPA